MASYAQTSTTTTTANPTAALTLRLNGMTVTPNPLASPFTSTSTIPPTHPHSKQARVCRATQLTPRFDRLLPNEPVAFDAEFQTYRPRSAIKWIQRLGRVGVVNTRGETVLDVYVYYPNEPGVPKRMPPPIFGVSYLDLKKDNGAQPAQRVERWIKEIVKGRTVVFHDCRADLSAMMYETQAFAESMVQDTQSIYRHLQWNGRPGLACCAAEVLGVSVQEGMHTPVEDADATMKLYLARYPNAFDLQAALAKVVVEPANPEEAPRRRGRRGRRNGRERYHYYE